MPQYRVPVLENYEFQPPVICELSGNPASPAEGDRYLVVATAIGDFAGQEDKIAWFDGSVWKFDAPKEGMLTYNKAEDDFVYYDGTSWKSLSEGLGLGDMLKSVYDTDDDGRVDKAESLDDGTNVVTAAEAKDAVDKAHDHANKAILDAIEEAFTTALKTAYDDAVSKAHVQGTDQYLDEGGANEVSAAEVKQAVTDSHTHANKAILDAIDVAFTTVLKGQYDDAYAKRAQWNANLGMIIFDL